jgi:hypothetical protein
VVSISPTEWPTNIKLKEHQSLLHPFKVVAIIHSIIRSYTFICHCQSYAHTNINIHSSLSNCNRVFANPFYEIDGSCPSIVSYLGHSKLPLR